MIQTAMNYCHDKMQHNKGKSRVFSQLTEIISRLYMVTTTSLATPSPFTSILSILYHFEQTKHTHTDTKQKTKQLQFENGRTARYYRPIEEA